MRAKHRVPDTYYINNDCTNDRKYMKITLNSTQKRQKNTKSAGRQKTSFPKEKVENADLYKPVLNKIMSTEE